MTIAEKVLRAKSDFDEVYEAGKQAEYDAFWDELQDFGERPHYAYAFAFSGWNDKNYNPKYSINPTTRDGIGNIFNYNTKITDTKVPITAYDRCANAFSNAQKLVKIPKLIFVNTSIITGMFTNCYDLEELYCEGTLSITGLDLHWSTKLNKASVQSVVGVLDETTTGLSITLSLNAIKKSFETSVGANDGNTSAEWTALVATKPNWTISLA
jgi:hypothetical protein